MPNYLGIDIGTTSIKAAVFDKTGTRIALKTVDYTLDSDAATGFITFDANEYIKICKSVIDELVLQCGKIDALSVDTQGETLIVTDNNGTPLMPAIVWLDNRATKEAEQIKAQFGNKRVYEITGQPEITATWPASKLLWLKHNTPEIFNKTARVFMLEDWVIYNLTGNFVSEPTIQSSTVYFDIVNKCWWDEMLSYIGITKTMLPEIVPSATAVGRYRGITVVTGALDQISGTIGVGVSDDTRVSEMTGTIMAVCTVRDTIPPYDPDSVVPCHLHAITDKYCLVLWSSTAGMALKWFKNNFLKDKSFKEIDELAKDVTAGSDGLTVLPYFCGATIPLYRPDATASFHGVTLSHTPSHFARAIMESVAFMLKDNLKYANVGQDSDIYITGGAALSKLWSQIKSDVTGHTLNTVKESETACLGTAILAMVGVGAYPTVKDAVDKCVAVDKVYTPCGDDYTKAYDKFVNLCKKELN